MSRREASPASSAFEMELEMRSVYRKAEESRDPVLRQKAGALVRALQQLGRGSAAPATAAVDALFTHCRDVVLRGPSTIIFQPASPPPSVIPPPNDPALLKPGRTITPAEAEAQTKRALRRPANPARGARRKSTAAELR